jgi:hypothetical protein
MCKFDVEIAAGVGNLKNAKKFEALRAREERKEGRV